MPGMLTGTIIGMAQALGETAPLLMIGMVAFIIDIPNSVLDPGTVLPVQIFMWADLLKECLFKNKRSYHSFIRFSNKYECISLFKKKLERRW